MRRQGRNAELLDPVFLLFTITDVCLYKEVLHGVLYPEVHGNGIEKTRPKGTTRLKASSTSGKMSRKLPFEGTEKCNHLLNPYFLTSGFQEDSM